MLKALVLLLAIIASIQQNARAAEISGEVFVITRAHESVKLGLVTIWAFKPDEISAAIAKTRESITPEIEKLKNLQPPAQQLEDQAQNVNDLLLRYEAKLFSESSDLYIEASLAVKKIEWRLDYLQSAAPFFERLPQPVASTKTDADGKFRLTLPDNSEVIIGAATSRKVADDTENYFWLLKVKPPTNVTFSNDNSCDTSGSDSVIRTLTISGTSSAWNSTDAGTLRHDLSGLADRAKTLASRIRGEERPIATGTAVLKQPFTFAVGYKRVTLGPGAQFELLSKSDSSARIRYENAEYELPLSIVDLK